MDATPRVARKAQAELTGILERIRGSPVVHADETGWREDGHNGYVWTFSTPTERYFLRRGRGKAVVDEVLGDQFAGVLVSDFYAAYHHYDGPSNAVGPTCCGTSTTCAHSTPMMTGMMTGWPNGLTPSTNSTVRRPPSPILQSSNGQSSNGAPPNWPWNSACWPSAVPTRMTHRPPQPGCADAWTTTSRNSSSLWLNQKSRRTTTPPSAACDRW